MQQIVEQVNIYVFKISFLIEIINSLFYDLIFISKHFKLLCPSENKITTLFELVPIMSHFWNTDLSDLQSYCSFGAETRVRPISVHLGPN